ncbi:hypothetical protein DM01DRAFT_176162 [Hesseltinella vesiculosa]|uniref:T-cell immunomodulatory protein TIP C2 domain-containing protein n=1 Tax=Hesseltinella vesiculosa TaxID=101127 RepID=A0A1X2GDD0_9FUNG|nr:hypothetical protein DM01DRAFT_176162 [Hesseltinella vesiculosa]
MLISHLFILDTSQTLVTVYTWNHKNFSFNALPNGPHIQTSDVIINVVPGDFNYDGLLDVMVMTQQSPGSSKEIKLTAYFGNGIDGFDQHSTSLPSASDTMPMLVDLNGDMRLDVLGYASGNTQPLSAWINTGNDESSRPVYNLTSTANLFDSASLSQCKWASPHSNAFVDLDGDCLADLVFVCEGSFGRKSVQIWTNHRDKGFHLAQSFALPANAGPLAFADMDGNGSIDLVFTTCDGHGCAIHTVYNQQIGLCSKLDMNPDTSLCRQSQHLCVADPNFKFDLTKPKTENYMVYDLTPVLDASEYVLTQDTAFRGDLPVPVHPGDYNLDGYPDLLITTNKRVLLLQSDLCTAATCPTDAVQAAKRTFSLVVTGADSLAKISSPRHATFFDIDEDGSLDILVLQGSASSKTAQRTPNFVINNYFNDAFFLKGLISNGATPINGSMPKPYGVNFPGGNFKFTVLDTSGKKRVHQVAQLPQSSYLSLQTPYSLFGLGRTNNYIEEMFAGVTRHQEQNYLFYEGVIPNSQLMFLPYQPDHITDSSTWKVELYVHAADYIPWVLASLIVAALVLAVVVAILYWMEKREDERERRKALHIINFDAL